MITTIKAVAIAAARQPHCIRPRPSGAVAQLWKLYFGSGTIMTTQVLNQRALAFLEEALHGCLGRRNGCRGVSVDIAFDASQFTTGTSNRHHPQNLRPALRFPNQSARVVSERHDVAHFPSFCSISSILLVARFGSENGVVWHGLARFGSLAARAIRRNFLSTRHLLHHTATPTISVPNRAKPCQTTPPTARQVRDFRWPPVPSRMSIAFEG